MPRSLVIYHYFELDELHRENLEYFLKHGYDDEVDYLFVIAGGCTLELPVALNISYLHMANAGGDFAGYTAALKSGIKLERYSYFIFLNSTVRGPFRPAYCGGAWTDIFTGMLRDDVHLAGATINILDKETINSNLFAERHGMKPPYPHVQSMIFALDRPGLEFLIDRGFFNRPISAQKLEVIADYEILMSQLIIANGWNINCLLPEYRNIDYRTIKQDLNPTSLNGDPCAENAYFGRSISPYEAVFIKANRNIISTSTLRQMSRSQGFRSDTASAYKRSEFDKVLSSLISTWRGHKNIALWLVNRIRPTVTVELGVDSGFSLLSLALTGIGNVYGIDSYEGDRDASFGDTRSQVEASIRKLRLNDVGLTKGRFKEVAQTWKRPIDLLHIDGMHDYESVKQNFNNWFSFLSPDGVVLMHDTCARDFGIRRFFDGIELPKINLGTSNGLGVISRNTALLQDVARIFEKQLETGTHAAT